MAHTLFLLRHAKSDWSGGERDLDRPLAPRGRRQAPEAGQWLARHAGPLDLAVVSPAARALQTWERVAAELSPAPETRLDDDVYAASGHDLLDVVRRLDEDLARVVLVGHNPGMEDLALRLTGEWVPLPTSALAVIDLVGAWSTAGDGEATLRASGRPPTA